MEIQTKLQKPENGTSTAGDNGMFDPNAYTQFINMQGPAIQGLMSNYLEQNAKAFVTMQEQMQQQANTMFSGFPFPPKTSSSKDQEPE
jgi:polyhydroxyalkanoate synthesis regulator protein